jgi:hypothetical protein
MNLAMSFLISKLREVSKEISEISFFGILPGNTGASADTVLGHMRNPADPRLLILLLIIL